MTESSQDFVLAGDEVEVVISKARGTVSRIVSLKPAPLEVLSETVDGLALAMADRWTGRRSSFGRCTALSPGPSRGGEYKSVTATLVPDRPDLANLVEASVEYRMYADRFRVVANARYLRDAAGPFEFTLGQKNPRADYWERQSFPGLWGNLDVLTPELLDKAKQTPGPLSANVYQRFSDHPDDVTHVPDCKIVRFPYGILEGRDRFLIYARMDVNGYVYLGAGHEGMNPCMLLTPRVLSRDKTCSFDLTYKFVSKTPEQDYADVCLWYAGNCYSTNRLSEGIIAIPADLKPRTLIGDGNEAGGPPMPVGDQTEFREWARKAHLGHFWDGWREWDEVPSLDAEFRDSSGEMLRQSDLVAEMGERHALGHRCYGYRRQLFPWFAYRDGEAWRREWMLSTRPGTVFVCPSGPEPVGNLPHGDVLSPALDSFIRGELGIVSGKPGRCSWIHADFCNDECRMFYTRALEKWIEKYDCLDGFAFDMGWDVHTTPCLAHPEDGTHHGIVRLMADIYKHLEKRAPEKRIVMNMLQGSPSNLWCHGVMFEGGVDMSYEAIESVKIYRATMFAHNYTWQFKSKYGDNWLDHLEYALLSDLALGVVIGMGDTMSWASHPDLNNKSDLYEVSSRLPSHPLVIETGAFLVNGLSRREIYRSVFADATATHALIFNNTDKQQSISARVRGSYLKQYGWTGRIPSEVREFDSRGYLKPASDFKASGAGGDIVISGSLGPRQMVALMSAK